MQNRILLSIFSVFLLFALTACGGARGKTAPVVAAATTQQNTQMAAYRLGSGDELRITIFGEDSMTGNYKVDGTGAISLPLVGNIMAGGLTVPELQARIGEHLSQGFILNPRVSVQVTNYRPFFILGEVNRPNQYPYVEGMKVINAVAVAGGYTYRADEDDMKIIRGNDPARVKERATPNTIVLPGDTIQIEERYF